MQLGGIADKPKLKNERRGSCGPGTSSGKGEGLLARLLSGAGVSKLGGVVGKELNRISAPAASAYQPGPAAKKEQDSPKQDSTASASAPCQASHR